MTIAWHSVLQTTDIPLDSYQIVQVGLISMILINRKGDYFALENMCTHDGGGLEGGALEAEEMICPRHGAGFCIKTGKVTRPPAYENIRSFPVRVQDGAIQVQLLMD